MIDPSGNSVTFKAHERFSTPSVTATYRGMSCTASFTVVEPETETAEKIQVATFPPGTQGVGMRLLVTIHPTDVSFKWVQFREVPGPATNVWGYYEQNIFTPDDLAHNPEGWIEVDSANQTKDKARFFGCPAPWYGGGFTWIIPCEWRVGESANVGTLPDRIQTFTIDDVIGTSTVTKFDKSQTRTP